MSDWFVFLFIDSGDMAGKPPTDRGLCPKETACVFPPSFPHRAPKSYKKVAAWSGSLNRAHMGGMVLRLRFDSSSVHHEKTPVGREDGFFDMAGHRIGWL